MTTSSAITLAVPAPTAVERLVISRALLRKALKGVPISTPNSGPDARHNAPAWLDGLRSIPVVNVLVEAISSWWNQHPLRIACTLAVDTTKTLVQPLARRNPLGVALGALLLGGLLVWSRPWRWIVKPALFAGLTSQLISKGIAHLPLQSWMATLVTVLQTQKPRPPSSTASSPSSPPR